MNYIIYLICIGTCTLLYYLKKYIIHQYIYTKSSNKISEYDKSPESDNEHLGPYLANQFRNCIKRIPPKYFTFEVLTKLYYHNPEYIYYVPDSCKTTKFINYFKNYTRGYTRSYTLIIACLPRTSWIYNDFVIDLLKTLECVFNEKKLIEDLKETPNKPHVAKILLNNKRTLGELDHHVLDGINFNHFVKYHGLELVKYLNKNLIHHGMDYSKGNTFEDINKFHPLDHATQGGLYFTLKNTNCRKYAWRKYYECPVKIPDNALVYFETNQTYAPPCFKTTKFILGDRTIIS